MRHGGTIDIDGETTPVAARLFRAAVAGALVLALAGCDSIFDVENPNQLTEEDATQPTAARALVNGALSTTARAYSEIMSVHSTAADELDFTGSRDAWLSLSQGDVADPFNEFTDAAFPFVAEARWTADEAVERLEGFEEEGTLDDPVLLGRAYLMAAVAYNIVADHFEDFAFSDRTEAAPPIGPDNMDQVYDQAVAYLDDAVAVARAEGDRTLERRALAMRAKTKFSRALWQKLNPPGAVPDDPLVESAGAASDAEAALAVIDEPNWAFRFEYSSSTVTNDMAAWVNDRSEMEIGSEYVELDESGTSVESVTLEDPIDGIPAPALEATVQEFEGGNEYAPLTVTSAREMRLILAEIALAGGDEGGFTEHVNAVRELDGLTPYSDQMDPVELLKHERRVNLFFQGRRLADHYRFGEPSSRWLSDSTARTEPGTMFPITAVERRSNCHILGTC